MHSVAERISGCIATVFCCGDMCDATAIPGSAGPVATLTSKARPTSGGATIMRDSPQCPANLLAESARVRIRNSTDAAMELNDFRRPGLMGRVPRSATDDADLPVARACGNRHLLRGADPRTARELVARSERRIDDRR